MSPDPRPDEMRDPEGEELLGGDDDASLVPDRADETLLRHVGPTPTDVDASSRGAAPPPPPTAPAGSRVPSLPPEERYDVQREHARGGMGRILLAVDTTIGREVAVKELLLTGTRGSGATPGTPAGEAGKMLERFLREARVTGRLEHPNIVPVHEIGERADGTLYYTMKFVRGRSLAERLDEIRDDASLDAAAKLTARLKLLGHFTDICNAIAYAHSKGIVHRDLKPGNVMLGEFGETLTVDWGLARVRGAEDLAAGDAAAAAGDAQLTQAGSVLGTPAYMAPEQARGDLELVDELADVYALGAILFEIVTGRAPWSGDALSVLARVQSVPAPSVAEVAPDVPDELAALVASAMAFERSDRLGQSDPASAAHKLGLEIEAWRDGRALSTYSYTLREVLVRTVKRHRGVVATAAAAMVLLASFLAYAEWAARREFDGKVADRRGEIAKAREAFAAAGSEDLLRRAEDESARLDARVLGAPEPLGTAAVRAALQAEMLAAAVHLRRAHDLAVQPVESVNVDLLSTDELDAVAAENVSLRLGAARLAARGGAWDLADQVVADSPLASTEERTVAQAFVDTQRTALLDRRRVRIEAALADAAAGLGRPDRPVGAPRLTDYVFELVGYRDVQTVSLLADVLRVHTERATAAPAEEGYRDEWTAKGPTPAEVSWTQEERDQITLACRVLGRIDMADAAAAALAPLSEVLVDHLLLVEVGTALAQTRSRRAWVPLYILNRRVGAGSVTMSAIQPALRRLPGPEVTDLPGFVREYAVGYAYSLQGDWAGVVKSTTAAMERLPDEAPARITRGRARQALGDAEGAEEDYLRAIELDPGLTDARVNVAIMLKRRGDLAGALEMLTAAVEQSPKHVMAVHNRAIVRWGLNDLDGVEADLTQALELDDRHALSYAMRGNLRHRRGDLDRAHADYARAIDLDPENAMYVAGRGVVTWARGDLHGALADFTRALELNPRDPGAYMNRSVVRGQLGDREGALADISTAIELNPTDAHAYVNRGGQHSSAGDDDAALADFERAEELDPYSVFAIVYQGNVHWRRDDLDAAIVAYARAIEKAPRHPLGHAEHGNAMRTKGRFELALADFDRALALDPNFRTALDGRAQVEGMIEARIRLEQEPGDALDRLERAIAAARLASGVVAEEMLRLGSAELDAAFTEWGAAELTQEQRIAAAAALSELARANNTHDHFAESVAYRERVLALGADVPDRVDEATLGAKSAGSRAAELAETDSAASAAWIDRAFQLLGIAADEGYADLAGAKSNSALRLLREDPRWPDLIARLRENEAATNR